MLGYEEEVERIELIDAGRLARGLDQLLGSLAYADRLDPLDVEGILALRSISERCADRIGDAMRILETAERGLLCRGARARSQHRPSKGSAPLSAGKPSRCSFRLFDSARARNWGGLDQFSPLMVSSSSTM